MVFGLCPEREEINLVTMARSVTSSWRKEVIADSDASSCGFLGLFASSPLDKQVKRNSLSLKRPLGCLIKKQNQSSCCGEHLTSSFCGHSRRWAQQHAYQIATRLQQISDRLLNPNQGTLYPALVRLEQYGWIKGAWGKTENSREAKYYEITRAGEKALGEETKNWRRMPALVERLLIEES